MCPRDAATEKTKGHHTQKHKLPPSPFDLKIRNKTSIIFCTAQDFAQLGCFMQMCASVVTGSLEHFTTSKRSPVPFSDLSYFPIPQPSQPLSLLPVCMDLSVLDVPYPWNHTAWASASDFSPLAVVSRFTHTGACVSVPFLPGTESNSRESSCAPENSSLFTAQPQHGSQESGGLGLKYGPSYLPAGDTGGAA